MSDLVPIRVGRVWIGVPATHVREVTAARALVPLKGAATLVRGLLEWRGRGIAAVDLHAWEMAPDGVREGHGQQYARLVVIQHNDVLIALQAHAVREVAADDQRTRMAALDLDALRCALVQRGDG
jgi:chemotaxis signal transduction protein